MLYNSRKWSSGNGWNASSAATVASVIHLRIPAFGHKLVVAHTLEKSDVSVNDHKI